MGGPPRNTSAAVGFTRGAGAIALTERMRTLIAPKTLIRGALFPGAFNFGPPAAWHCRANVAEKVGKEVSLANEGVSTETELTINCVGLCHRASRI